MEVPAMHQYAFLLESSFEQCALLTVKCCSGSLCVSALSCCALLLPPGDANNGIH
jgi:hypothetical protein